jgi:hypothetical protein
MWGEARIVLGMPANLLYHIVLSCSMSVLMWWVVRIGWPLHLDQGQDQD